MSKLCQCRRSKLLDRLWDIPDPYEDLVNQQLEDVEKILESDCVCEKKEERHHLDTHCLFCDNDLPVGQDGGYCTGCLTILKENAEKEKQSQSSEKRGILCNAGDHEYESTGMVLTSIPPQYPSKCTKCGLTLNLYTHLPKKELIPIKQSQSPCKHRYCQKVKLTGNLTSYLGYDFEKTSFNIWICHKCGLVTCLNPNQ